MKKIKIYNFFSNFQIFRHGPKLRLETHRLRWISTQLKKILVSSMFNKDNIKNSRKRFSVFSKKKFLNLTQFLVKNCPKNYTHMSITFNPLTQNACVWAFWKGLAVLNTEKIRTKKFWDNFFRVTSWSIFFFFNVQDKNWKWVSFWIFLKFCRKTLWYI